VATETPLPVMDSVDFNVEKLDDFQRILRSNFQTSDWVFRGQEKAYWILEPTLERAIKGTRAGKEAPEKGLLLNFQRRAHHYTANPPSDGSYIEWLALMQHYGAPTRLLDWTFSPYVGLYFALENAHDGDCCVWAVNGAWLNQDISDAEDPNYRPSRVGDINLSRWNYWLNENLFSNNNAERIVMVNPLRMNERVAPQQGVFLCALSYENRFFTTLTDLVRRKESNSDRVGRIFVKPSCRLPLLRELNRMNINRASLFPGLDGFARSLGIDLQLALFKTSQ
jgi:hypothetical protein